MGQTLKERLTATSAGRRAWQRERTLFEAGNIVCELMAREGISRRQLARKLKVTKTELDLFLDGRGLSLEILSDMLTALGHEVVLKSRRFD